MFAQLQGFSITSLDELVISPSQFNDFMTDADSCLHPIGAIYMSSARLLRYSFWLAEQKATLPRKEYKELLSQLNWKGEEKAYLKVDAAFNTFTPYELAQIEPRTIFQIALNFKKYQSVIPQMKALPQITQDKVRGFMKQCHKPRASREEQAPTIWQLMPDGQRACQIGPIYNQSVGVMLEAMMTAEGRTAQSIVEEALLALYESKYGFPTEQEAVSSELTQDISSSAPYCNVVSENQTAPDFPTNFVTLDESTSWDAGQVTIEDLKEESSFYDIQFDKDEGNQDVWSFEPLEKDDFIEDYEFLTSAIEAQSKIPAPVDLLIQTFQTANSWEEISNVLKTHEEYKQEAWDALTPIERKKIIKITPPTITRLSNAKREGLIMDFRFVREGVYHIKGNGSLFWDTVFEYRVEEYLARL